ncbi:MAG TPA: tetratricopeptide repeat protein [Thermoanaerobaculia bacterium]|jgi:serine/threonine-protein kinase|nr:tetratricopeptide repeat protein [Thermoanaerobaculia bacterium]
METGERDNWRAACELLEELLDLPPAERDAALGARAPSPEVATKVRELLAAADREEGVLEQPPPWPAAGEDAAPAALAGARFGPYEVVDEIGRGGMAVVYRARRADGQFQRDVALKLLTLGAWALGSLGRRRHEQAVLARLEHPGIASLLDAGVTADGTPWLAMELIDGEPIDAWCERRQLAAAAIVRLFLQACDAVAFAHRNLVVHRDLKPSNIFVDRDGRVRLLDFGIAKLLDEAVPDATVTRVFTPGYAAPEQLAGRAVTTATDVYGMGAVLHRLLARQSPFPRRDRLASAAAAEDSPAPPSAVAGHVAGIDRDLDNAVAMALRAESERRYPTAEALRDDLARWLEGRPLHATPDRLGYRFRKYARRHRAGVAAALLALVGLVGGSSLALWQASVARAESRRARAAAAETQQQLRRAEEVTRFLVDAFAAADPYAHGGKDVTADEIVAEGVRRIDRELRGQPAVRRQMLAVLGEMTYHLADFPRAEELLHEALATPDASAEERVRILRLAAMTASAAGDYPKAEERFAAARALAAEKAIASEPRVALELDYATHLSNSDHPEQTVRHIEGLLAEPWFRQAGALASARAGAILGQALGGAGRFAEARTWLTRSLPALERELGANHLELAETRSNLSGIEADLGNLEPAERLEHEALAVFAASFGPTHPRTLLAKNDLSVLLKGRGDFAASARLLEEVAAAQTTALGRAHPFLAATYLNLGEARLLSGDITGALESYRRAVDMADGNPLAYAQRRGIYHGIYGRALGKAGDVRRAEQEFLQGLRILAESLGPAHPITARITVEYAAFLNDRQRHTEACGRVEQALPVLSTTYGEGSRELALARLQRGRCLLPTQPAAAREALRSARDALQANPYHARYAAEIRQAGELLASPRRG